MHAHRPDAGNRTRLLLARAVVLVLLLGVLAPAAAATRAAAAGPDPDAAPTATATATATATGGVQAPSSPATRTSGAPAGVRIHLTTFSPAVPLPGQTLTLAGTVTNDGATVLTDPQIYLRLTTAPLTSRAGMAAFLAAGRADPGGGANPGAAGNLYLGQYVQLKTLVGGSSANFVLAVAVSALGLGAAGVYPLAVELRANLADGSRIAAADVATYLPWLSTPAAGVSVRPSPTVEVGWIVPLTTAAVRISHSVLVDGTLAASLGPTGRLGRLLALLDSLPAPSATGSRGTTVQIAIDPLLVSEVQAMAGGYRVVDFASRTTTGTSAATPAGATATPGVPRPGASTGPSASSTDPGLGVGSPTTTDPPAAGAATHGSKPLMSTAAPARTGDTSTTGATSLTGSAGPRTSSGAAGPPAVGGVATGDTADVATALPDQDLAAVHTRAGGGAARARDWLAQLRRVVAGRTVFVLPWADPDLGAVADPATDLGEASLGGTWARGLALIRGLGATAVPLAWPSVGRDTRSELGLAGRAGAGTVLLPSAALLPAAAGDAHPGDPSATLAGAPAGSPTVVLRADTGLDTALAATTNPIVGRQSYLAETALLALGGQAPGTYLAVLPRDWDPHTTAVGGLLFPIAHATWLRRAPVLTAAAQAGAGRATLGTDLARVARARPGDPASAAPVLTTRTRRQLAAVGRACATLTALLSEPSAVRQGLRAQRLQLASVALVTRPLRWARLAGAVLGTVRGIRAAVSLVPPSTVSLSSASGVFPVVVTNRLAQAVRIRIVMTASTPDRLQVAPINSVTVPAGQSATVRVHVTSTARGLVEVQAVLQDSAGGPLGPPVTFAVHASFYDQIGWVILITASAVLFGATAVRLARRIHAHARNRAT